MSRQLKVVITDFDYGDVDVERPIIEALDLNWWQPSARARKN